MRTKGKITSWNDGKGYGFISPLSGGKQIFVHIKAFRTRNRRPEIGQVVAYDISSDKHDRPCAVKATFPCEKLQRNKKKNSGNISIAITIIFLSVVIISVLENKLPPIILAIYTGLSILTFIVYAADKSAAKKGAWRIQESTLHLFALAGGWPGALIAQQKLRHKTKKESFRFVFWVTVLINGGVFVWLFTEKWSVLLHSLLQRIA